MPVLPYYSQKEPPPESVIWRFLDLRKFRDLMANQELYFRRADLFDDQTEGLPPEQYVRACFRTHPLRHTRRISSQQASRFIGSKPGDALYFHAGIYIAKEDLAIWEQYGSDGVAVTSRYGLLKECLDSHT